MEDIKLFLGDLSQENKTIVLNYGNSIELGCKLFTYILYSRHILTAKELLDFIGFFPNSLMDEMNWSKEELEEFKNNLISIMKNVISDFSENKDHSTVSYDVAAQNNEEKSQTSPLHNDPTAAIMNDVMSENARKKEG